MGQAWVGDTVRAGTPETLAARQQGYGVAVWLDEETNVQVVVGTEYAASSAHHSYAASGLTSGYYRVRLNADGLWEVTY